MSRDQLIDLITREVVKIVKNKDGGGSAGGSTPLPAAAATSTCNTSGSKAPMVSKPASGSLGNEPLFVVCGNHLGKDGVFKLVPQIKNRFKRFHAVLSSAATGVFSGPKRIFAGFQVSAFSDEFDQHMRHYTSVVVLNTSVNTLAKLAQLIADTEPTVAIFKALKEKKPVYMTTDPLLPWQINAPITQKIQGYLREMESFGVSLLQTDEILGRLGGTTSAGAPAGMGSGGVLPFPSKDQDCRTCAWAGHCATLCSDRVSAVTGQGAGRIAAAPLAGAVSKDLARMIDHTLLKADATEADIRKLCDEAATNSFFSVCINPTWVSLAAKLLKGSKTKVCTVVGFPLGATSSQAKEAETREAIRDGADEIDMVINVGALKAGKYALVLEDIKAVVRGAQGRTTKVILETALLNEDEKRKACELSRDAGADFVKTSTGFGPGGATVEDIKMMREIVGPRMGVKASGGVRDTETANKMIKAGANRIGASASVAIVQGKKPAGGGGHEKPDAPQKQAYRTAPPAMVAPDAAVPFVPEKKSRVRST